MAQLLTWLAGAGARTSAGDPVTSGFAWFYETGGGTTQAIIYTDVDGTVVATQPVALDAGGRATVYTILPVRAVIQDATGADVTDKDQANVVRAEAVQMDNADWTSVFLDDALTAIGTSTGGDDAMYLESSGATARTIKAKFSELCVSVKDFGAKGDGLQVDTTAVQAAINRVSFLGGGIVYFPPGTYKLDQVLTVTTSGVSLVGAGQSATVLRGDFGLSMTSCDAFALRNLKIFTQSTSANATGLTLSTCTNFTVDSVFVNGFYVALAMTTCQQATFIGANHFRSPSAAGAASRSMTLTDTTLVTVTGALLDAFGAASYTVEVLGSSGKLQFFGSAFTSSGTAAVRFDAALTGLGHRFVGNSFAINTAYFSFGGATMPGSFYQRANGIDGYKGTLLSGATFTPDLSKGWSFVIDCTTTGVANVVAVPTPPPAATDYGVYIDIVYYAHAGGALTATSGFAAGYHVSAAASLTDTNRSSYRFWWDPDASVWRECSRSVTT